MDKITIIGLGLIGTSLGLALKEAKLSGIEIVGTDQEPNHSSLARKKGAVDQIERNLLKAVQGARIVVLAVPVMAIRDIFELISPHLEKGCVITDTGSTKRNVLDWAGELLGNGVHYVGGHPMAGRESSGPEAADGKLFQGCYYAICPSVSASKAAVESVVNLVEAIGANPYYVDAEEHDTYTAGVSHLPFLLSTGLVATTTSSPSWLEMGRLAATGYKDISRLASGDPVMHRDICLTNSESVVYWLDEFIKNLYQIRNMIQANEDGALEKLFVDCWEARARWLADTGKLPIENPEIPSAGEGMMSMLVGGNLARRMRDLNSRNQTDKTRYNKR